MLSFFLVALGVGYPIGSLAQGPVIDWIGLGWTTAGTAVLLALIMAVAAVRWPGFARAIINGMSADVPGFLVRKRSPELAAAHLTKPRDRAARARSGSRPRSSSASAALRS